MKVSQRFIFIVAAFLLIAGSAFGQGTTGSLNGRVRVDEGSELKRPAAKPGTQLVMATGKAAWSTARPIKAGLNGFWPRPPKSALPRSTPMAPPTATIQSGSPGGSVRP